MSNVLYLKNKELDEHFKVVIESNDPAEMDCMLDGINSSPDIFVINKDEYIEGDDLMRVDLTSTNDDEVVIGYMITANIYSDATPQH